MSAAHGIVEHPVQVSLLGIHFHRPTVYIANRIGGTALGADGGDSEEERRRLPDGVEKVGRGEVGTVVGAFKLAVRAGRIAC